MTVPDNANETKGGVGSVVPVSIEKELKTAFLDYAMSVIVSRALPDVRDGLKPVHRRILYAMHEMGLYHEKGYRKSATVVGEVMGHYHPHGDSAIYQTMVGLVQLFSKRYPLLDGQGNWGSIDGDNAAAMRYTECRMARIARDLLADIEKKTVHFVPNFDESCMEPEILPSKIPNLLVNGSTGIAVGMATSVPPHNLGEIVEACLEILKDPTITDERLFEIVPAPDFPTGGIICGRGGIVKAYKTGYGQVIVRGVVNVEETKKNTSLIITELPYQVNKADLIKRIADLVKEKVIEGISNIRDESDRDGIRVVIEVKRNDNPQVILNLLYKHTSLQNAISIIMLALYQNRPILFTLREMIEHFLLHRREVITKRCEFELAKNKARAHILDGILVALANIDDVVALIKKSRTTEEAIAGLNARYQLSAEQCRAILDMRLQRLTGLEQDKIRIELEELAKLIARLELILSDEKELKGEIAKELEYIKQTYADKRRSVIEGPLDGMSEEDFIPDQEVLVTLTRKGYIKRIAIDTYTVQHRGGKGKKGTADLEDSDDLMLDAFVAHTHDELLFFTNKGRVFGLKVYQIPEGSRTAKGRAIVNILQLTEGEEVVRLLCARDMENRFLVMITRKGVIKKTDAGDFTKIRSNGIRAVSLNEGDELAFCAMSSGTDSIIIATHLGQGIHFKETEVRAMGRNAAGVRGISLRDDDHVVGLEVIPETSDILFATSKGYGKRVRVVDFRVAHRGGLGVRTIPCDTRNGFVIGLKRVSDESHVLLIDSNGKVIRLSPQEIRTMGRQAKGVRLVRLDAGQSLASMVAFDGTEEEQLSSSPDAAQAFNQQVQNVEAKADQNEIFDLETETNNDDDASEK